MNGRLKGRKGFITLKLDISKTHDRVEQIFLEKIMKKMGFDSRWIQLIMKCVTTVTYSVLVNGQPHDSITLTRGIRQRNPFSPYLFIICVEALSSILSRAESNEDNTSLAISK